MKCLIIDVVHEPLPRSWVSTWSQGQREAAPRQGRAEGHDRDVDVLIMRVDPMIDKEVLDAAKNLKVIGVCSVGLNHIDTKYAEEKGIKVFTPPA